MNDISTLIERARQTAAPADASSSSTSTSANPDRQKLMRVAQEFESMLLGQMLKDMRNAGKWDASSADCHEKYARAQRDAIGRGSPRPP